MAPGGEAAMLTLTGKFGLRTVMVALVEAVQPLLSVTVTVYVPDVNVE